MKHTTVLLQEAVDALALESNAVVVDATLGAGGHAQAILNQLGKAGTLIAFDADSTAIEAAQGTLTGSATVHLVHGNFATLSAQLERLGIDTVDAVLADLGWRMEQFSTHDKGFSFSDPAGLSMTYGHPEDYSFTAADIVNEWAAEDIANVLYGYGEERYSRRIAAAIVATRTKNPITTAVQLASIIEGAVPAAYRRGRTHAATKSFQALRIAVNDELTVLETFINHAFMHLIPGGHLAIISFHSIEDRIVKQKFRAYAHDQQARLLTKKPIIATKEELQNNPRARSAKLRVLQKLTIV